MTPDDIKYWLNQSPEVKAEKAVTDATRYQWMLDHTVILDGSTEGLTVLTIASDATSGCLSDAVERAINLAMEKK